MCVCVCVCVRDHSRLKEKEQKPTGNSELTFSRTLEFLVSENMSTRERERERERHPSLQGSQHECVTKSFPLSALSHVARRCGQSAHRLSCALGALLAVELSAVRISGSLSISRMVMPYDRC